MFIATPQSFKATPRAASQTGTPRLAGRALAAVGRAGGAVWRYLEDVGQERADRELRLLAARWDIIDPEMAGRLHESIAFDATGRKSKTQSVEERS